MAADTTPTPSAPQRGSTDVTRGPGLVERIAWAIRVARQARGLTQGDLASALGCARGTVNRWEAGESLPSLAELGPLCVALGVTPRLFAEPPEIPPPPPDLSPFLVEP